MRMISVKVAILLTSFLRRPQVSSHLCQPRSAQPNLRPDYLCWDGLEHILITQEQYNLGQWGCQGRRMQQKADAASSVRSSMTVPCSNPVDTLPVHIRDRL